MVYITPYFNSIKINADEIGVISHLCDGINGIIIGTKFQSGFQLEQHNARSLAFVGQKKVERVSQTASGRTHSFTILPIHHFGGSLGKKLYIQLQTYNGNLPSGLFSAPNLFVTSGKSHIMGKEHLQVGNTYVLSN